MHETVACEKLREAFDRFPGLVQEVNTVIAYCDGSCRALPKQPQKPMRDFINDFQDVLTGSRDRWDHLFSNHPSPETLVPLFKFQRAQDVAVFYAWPLFWKPLDRIIAAECNTGEISRTLTDLLPTVGHLSSLLVPVADELLPTKEHGSQLWKAFGEAELLWRQYSVLGACQSSSQGYTFNEPLVQGRAHVGKIMQLFQEQHVQMVEGGDFCPNLDGMMTEFAKELVKWDNFFSHIFWTPPQCGYFNTRLRDGMIPEFTGSANMVRLFTSSAISMTEQLSLILGKASQIATLLSISASPDVNSLGSWSIVSSGECAEVGSVASCNSVDSQTSYLSGRGGPHCFLPSHLFKQLEFEEARSSSGSSTSFVFAQAWVASWAKMFFFSQKHLRCLGSRLVC